MPPPSSKLHNTPFHLPPVPQLYKPPSNPPSGLIHEGPTPRWTPPPFYLSKKLRVYELIYCISPVLNANLNSERLSFRKSNFKLEM